MYESAKGRDLEYSGRQEVGKTQRKKTVLDMVPAVPYSISTSYNA